MSRCVPQPKGADCKSETTSTPRATTLASLSAMSQALKLVGVPDAWYEFLERDHRTQYFVPPEETETFLKLLNGERMELPSVTPKYDSMCEVCPPEVPTSTLPYCLVCPTVQDQHEYVQHEQQELEQNVQDLIQCCHNAEVGHGGVDRTLQLLQELKKKKNPNSLFEQWNTMLADVKRYVRNCPIC